MVLKIQEGKWCGAPRLHKNAFPDSIQLAPSNKATN